MNILKSSRRNTFFCMLLAGSLLAGCVLSDQNLARLQGGGLGAVGGGLTGFGLSKVLHSDSETTVWMTSLGTAIGTGFGLLYAEHVISKKAAYATQEEYLHSVIASTRSWTEKTRIYNNYLRNKIPELEYTVQRLVSQYNQGKIRTAVLQKEQQRLQYEFADANNNLNIARDVIAVQKQVLENEKRSSSNNSALIAQLNSEISQLERDTEELENNAMYLASIDQRIKL